MKAKQYNLMDIDELCYYVADQPYSFIPICCDLQGLSNYLDPL